MASMKVGEFLRRICYEAGRLVTVEHVLLRRVGCPALICAIRLTCEASVFVLRAVAEDDTIAVAEGDLLLGDDEVCEVVTDSVPWATCVGQGVQWAWVLTNQQGYEDGVRLEVEGGDIGVDLVVAASGFRVYAFTAVR